MKKVIILISTILLIVVFLILASKDEEPKSFLSATEKKLNELTLEQKIGQLFIIGIEGKSLTLETENLIRELHPGGILLLQRNIADAKQLKELIDSLQKIALEDTGLPLFIAVDQEGGSVSRIDWVEKTPQSSYEVGKKRGAELKDLGVNLNLAPLLDTSSEGDFIYERSFVVEGLALIQGQKDAGIFTAIKHFPGYGGIPFNPEEKLATLDKVPEIQQFLKAFEASPEMIMTANVIYKEIDEDLPFTFSRKGIDFLKSNIPGDYIIISDDLSQNSLLNEFSLEEIISLPIKAGVDLLIFSGWRSSVFEGITTFRKIVARGDISEKRIDRSTSKIIKLKL